VQVSSSIAFLDVQFPAPLSWMRATCWWYSAPSRRVGDEFLQPLELVMLHFDDGWFRVAAG
jgi:hypothetical protein